MRRFKNVDKEDANESFNVDDKVTTVKESEEYDIRVLETASKKKKDSMVSEVNLNPEDMNSDNEDMFSSPERVGSKSNFVEEGIKGPVAVENEEQEAVEDGQPPTEGDDVFSGNIRRDSGGEYNYVKEETISAEEDEKPPLVSDEDGSSSTLEAVRDKESAESATITTTVDGAADGPVVNGSSTSLPIVDDVESDTGDNLCDVPVDNEGWVHMHLITINSC